MMMFSPASAVLGQIEAGKLTVLASAAGKRPSILPNVPTMAEAGMPDFDTSIWFGLMAPAGISKAAIDKLAGAVHQTMQSPDAVAALHKQGFDPLSGGPDVFGPFVSAELIRWSHVAEAAGLKK